MMYAASDSVERVVALVAAADDWVLVFPATMSIATAAAYALQRIAAQIPAPIAAELRSAIDLPQTG